MNNIITNTIVTNAKGKPINFDHSNIGQTDVSSANAKNITSHSSSINAKSATTQAGRHRSVQEDVIAFGAEIVSSVLRISKSFGKDVEASSGIAKMTQGIELMGAVYAAAGALSPELALFLEDSKNSSDAIEMGKNDVNSRLCDHKKSLDTQMTAIKKQAKSKKKKSFWGKLKSALKAIVTVVAVVGAVLSGGTLAIIGAGLMIASMVAAKFKSKFAKYLSFGLAIASIAFGGAGSLSSLGGQAFAGVSEGIAKGIEAVGAVTGAAGSFAEHKEIGLDKDVTNQAANILEIETSIDLLFAKIDDSIDTLKETFSNISKSAQRANQIVQTKNATQNKAADSMSEGADR